MLPQIKIEQIEKLLAEGKLSQRKIAVLTGVSRGVISQVALGTRPDYEGRRVPCVAPLESNGQVARCPTCGARVYMPCRLCHLRHLEAQSRVKRYRRRARQKAARRLLAAVLRREEVQQATADQGQARGDSSPADVSPPVEPSA